MDDLHIQHDPKMPALNKPDLAKELIAAIHGQTLGAATDRLCADVHAGRTEADEALLAAAMRAGAAIEAASLAARHELANALRAEDIHCEPGPTAGDASSRQLHRFRLRLTAPDPTPAIAVAERLGYRPPIGAAGAAWSVFWRTNAQIVLTRQDDVGMRAQLEWPLGRVGRTWPWRLRPGMGDVRGIRLPERWWPLATGLAVLRRVTRGWRRARAESPQWGWMGTPPALLEPLFRFAGLGGDDVLLDLGSGDGRVAIEAARRFGIRTIGVELDPALCRTAVRAADAAGVADRVDIRCAQAADAPIESASVVFLFLPIAAVNELVPELLRRLPEGGRIVAHEQAPVTFAVPPDRTAPMFGETAVTVAYLWSVRR